MTTISDSDHRIRPSGSDAPVTGASMPSGGVGFTGWLSAIWKAITSGNVIVGTDLAASGLAAVTGTVTSAASSAGLAVKAGRLAYLWLSGGTSASGHFEWSRDAGVTWSKLYVEGNQLGTFSYAGSAAVVPVPALEEAGVQVRATFAAASGSVSYRLEQ